MVDLLSFLLLVLALLLILRLEVAVFIRLRLATMETIRGIVFLITLGRVRMRPRVMAARSRHKERVRNFKYWLEDRRMGDITPEFENPADDDPYGKWITAGNQTPGGIGGAEGLRQASLDDYSHLSEVVPDELVTPPPPPPLVAPEELVEQPPAIETHVQPLLDDENELPPPPIL